MNNKSFILGTSTDASPPPAAIAPGPAGLGGGAFALPLLALGAGLGLAAGVASSSAYRFHERITSAMAEWIHTKSRAFSAFRAASAAFLAAFSSAALLVFAPEDQSSASFFS